MAGVIGMSGSGGRRPLDATIHLVPLIDLLCSLISFLLMTAIWAQISRLELKNGAGASESQAATPPEEQKMLLKVQIHDKGFAVIEQSSGAETQIPCREKKCWEIERRSDDKGLRREAVVSAYDYAKLEATLKTEKAKFTDQKNVAIVLGDNVPYNEMIKTMDTCLAVGLDGISLSGSVQ